MIDLHIHLDGSLSKYDILSFARYENKHLIAKDLVVSVGDDCTSLNDYLKLFTLPLSLMQTTYAIKTSVACLMFRLFTQGIIYTEIRFAPQLHTRNGLTQTQVVEAAIEGIKKGALETNGAINAQLILCCMREKNNEKENLETIHIANKFLRKGVCAVDLAGAEGLFPTSSFEKIFKVAKDLKIPFTIHAGEASGAASVHNAIMFGAKRIGHGVRAIENESILQEAIDNKVVFEFCPTSNVQTRTLSSIKKLPLREYINRGALVTINTDNVTVSETSIKKEFVKVINEFSLSKEEVKQLLLNSAHGAFINDEEKKALAARINRDFNEWYSSLII
ncbi:MAG: adenosine deaminase [Bacilli bacterium]